MVILSGICVLKALNVLYSFRQVQVLSEMFKMEHSGGDPMLTSDVKSL